MRWFTFGGKDSPDIGCIRMETVTHVEAHQDAEDIEKNVTTVHVIGGSKVELRGESAIRFLELINLDETEDKVAIHNKRMESHKSPDEIARE